MAIVDYLTGLLGLLVRPTAPQSPAAPVESTPPLDPTMLYQAMQAMGMANDQQRTPFELYSTRAASDADMQRIFNPAIPPKGVVPEGVRPMAMDDINNPMQQGGFGFGYTEGLHWFGFPYLAELSQRTEYRRISEVIAKDMTRRWFRLQASGDDDKTDRISQLEDAIEFHKLKEKFTLLALLDGFFGRAHLYIDTGDSDDPDIMRLPLPVDPRMITKGKLKGIRVIEPMWCYPHVYNANDPLKENFYLPTSWWVMSKEIHRTRLLPFIGREMPDMLKPAYSFGGLSLSQMAKPYVDNWLRTRQSVSDLIHSFSTPVLMTNMGSILNAGASDQLRIRAALFNYMRDNSNMMALDKNLEDFKNVSAPLGGLDHLQAQSQEHISSAVGIPLIILHGITPSGLNASSDGELQVWAQFIHAQQSSFFDAHLSTILNILMLDLFGEIDEDIVHAWEPLRELSEEEEAQAEKQQSDTDVAYINAGVLSPDEIRQRLAGEADSPYQGLDLDSPAPPPPQQEPDPLGGAPGVPGGGGGPPGMGGPPGGASGNSLPAGGAPGPIGSSPVGAGQAGGSAAAPNPNKGSRDADLDDEELDPNGYPAIGKSHTKIVPKNDDVIDVYLQKGDIAEVRMGLDMAIAAIDAFEESKHKRNHGKFSKMAGGASEKPRIEPRVSKTPVEGRGREGESAGREGRFRTANMQTGIRHAIASTAHKGAEHGITKAKEFGDEDYHALKAIFDPADKRAIHAKVLSGAQHLVTSKWHEEQQNLLRVSGAALALTTGHRPTKEQWQGVRSISYRLGMTAVMSVLTGDPTGTLHHGVSEVAHHFAAELGLHAAMEHAFKTVVGAAKVAKAKVVRSVLGRRAPTSIQPAHDEDPYAMANQLVLAFADAFLHLDEATVRELMKNPLMPVAQDDDDDPAMDEFKEGEHERDENGKFTGGGASGGIAVEPEDPDEPDRPAFTIKKDGKKIGRASGTGGARGRFIDSVMIDKEHQNQGHSKAIYEQIESLLGHRLLPSPLGLSEQATRVWQKRLAKLPRAEAEAMIEEAKKLGREAGITREEHLSERLDPLLSPKHAQDREFREEDVDRDEGGKFASQGGGGGGGGGAAKAEAPKPEAQAEAPKAPLAPATLTPEQHLIPTPSSTMFVSPSVAEGLNLGSAASGLTSERQRLLETASQEIDANLGLRATHHGALGAWSDGAENSLMVEMEGGDFEKVKLAAAMKASLANQKAALVFQASPEGNANLYRFHVSGEDVNNIHQQMLRDGVTFHTIVPTSDGATVFAVDLDGDVQEAFERAADRYGTTPTYQRGQAEFIGTDDDTGTADEQRHKAQLAYARIIKGSGVAGGAELWKGIQPTYGTAFEVTEYPKEETTTPLEGSAAGSHPATISSARATAAGIVEGDRYRSVNLEAMKAVPKTYEKNMNLLRNPAAYPNFRPEELEGKTPDELARVAIDHAKANLRFLYNAAPEDVRKEGPLWYEGAHNIAKAAAEKFSIPLASAAAVYAALSPQKLWDHNVTLGDKVLDTYFNKRNEPWSEKMTATATRIWKPKDDKLLARIRGKTLAELQLPAEKAMWIRTYDEAHNDQGFNRLSADGHVLGDYFTLDGKKAKGGWQGLSAISNAITAIESGGNREAISLSMGDRNKVRSFYNNILDPHSGNKDVTMDTHAVGAVLLRPETGNSTTVAQSLGTSPEKDKQEPGFQAAGSISGTGAVGTYGLWADAYRELADELGIEPRVLQSVTWVAKRQLFDDRMTKETRGAVQRTWREYHAGERDLESTQKEIVKLAGGFDKPPAGLPQPKEPKPIKAAKAAPKATRAKAAKA